MSKLTTIVGHQIQVDNSGVGHNWRNIDRENIPANIIEDGKESCADFVASNGKHYRW